MRQPEYVEGASDVTDQETGSGAHEGECVPRDDD